MRIFRYIALVLACSALLSCGGGNSGTSGRANISLKINFDQQTKSGVKDQAKLIVSNTLINNVIIGYGPSGGVLNIVNATSAAENGTAVTLAGIELNKPYTFSISAFGADSVLVCDGSDTATVHSNGTTDIKLTCSFKEKYAVENLAYDIMSKIVAGDPMGNSDLNSLVAKDFGIKDGMSRSEYIKQLAYGLDDGSKFLFSDVSLLKTEVVEPKTKDASTTTNVKFFFSDGSYYTEPMNFVKEDDTWKITGNGRELAYKMYPQAVALADAGMANATIYTGYRFEADDRMTDQYNSFIVAGSGLDGVAADNQGTYFALNPVTVNTSFGDINNHFIDVAGLEDGSLSIPAGTSYGISAEEGNSDTVTEQAVMDGAGIAKSGLDSTMFPSVSAIQSNDMYSFSVTLPTAYTPSRVELHAYFADTAGGAKIAAKSAIKSASVDSMISLTDKTFTIDMNKLTGGLWTPAYGYIELTAYDENGRAFSTYVTSGAIDYSGTSVTNGVNTIDSSSKMALGLSAFIKSIYTQYETATGTVYSPATMQGDSNGLISGTTRQAASNNSVYDTVFNVFILAPSYGSLFAKQLTVSSINSYGDLHVMKDDSGNIYGVSQVYSASSNNFMIAVMKIDGATGSIDWVKSYDSTVSSPTYLSQAVLTLSGDRMVVMANSSSATLLLRIVLDDGSFEYAASYTAPSHTLNCNQIKATSSGRYILGCYNQTAPVIMALAPDLSVAASIAIDTQMSGVSIDDMGTDTHGNIYFAMHDDTKVVAGKITSDIGQAVFTGFSGVSAVSLTSSSDKYTSLGAAHIARSGDSLYVAFTGYSADQHDRVEYVNKLSTDLDQVWSLRAAMEYVYGANYAHYFLNRIDPAPLNSVTLSFNGLLMAIPSNGNTSGLNADVRGATDEINLNTYSVAIPQAVVNSNTPGSFNTATLPIVEGVAVKLFISNYNMWNGNGALTDEIYAPL